MTMKATALAYAQAGLSIIPTLADKRPACAWKEYTKRLMTEDEIERNFRTADGIGVVCGKVSGNLELLDFDDGGSAFEPWLVSLSEELAKKLVVETSPSGGKHVYYRVDEDGYVPGNRKLAMKKDGRVLIETRGEGGFVKCAPSKEYELMSGSLLNIQKVSPIEQAMLIEAAVELDEQGLKGLRGLKGLKSTKSAAEGITIDDGEFRAVLEKHGWKRVREDGKNEHWERPGKDGHSTSATFNGDVFYVFSSNAMPFEPNHGYNKFQVYAMLEHNGDFKSAAFALRIVGDNYLTQSTQKLRQNLFVAARRDTACDETTFCRDDTNINAPSALKETAAEEAQADGPVNPGAVPEELLSVPGFVNLLADHTMRTAPYPNRTLAFAGAITMLAHLTGRNYRNERNLRTNLYLLALADSGVGKDYPRKVNMNLAAEINTFGGMADRFASAEGLEDSLLLHPASFFQVDEIDTLFAALNEKGDSSMERIYGSLLQFATSADATFAMRKKAITQVGGKQSKFDKVRARGIREPHLVLLGTGIPKYLWSAVSSRAMENGLLSRCIVLEAGDRGKAGNPHFEPFSAELLTMARSLVSHGGFEGLDLENLEEEQPEYREPFTIAESDEAKALNRRVVEECEALYDAAMDTSEKALWSRGAEKTDKLALLYAISENVEKPLITAAAVEWAWKLVQHLTLRMLYQASVYVHDNEFDALRQKAIRYLRDYGKDGSMNHGALLKRMHIDTDTFRRVIETLVQSEIIVARELSRGGFMYKLI